MSINKTRGQYPLMYRSVPHTCRTKHNQVKHHGIGIISALLISGVSQYKRSLISFGHFSVGDNQKKNETNNRKAGELRRIDAYEI